MIFNAVAGRGGGLQSYSWRVYSGTIDENTILLLHGDSFEDASPNAHAVQNTGVTLSNVQTKFGSTSFCFDGSSWMKFMLDEIKWAEDFTLDFWIYHTSAAISYPTPFSLSYPANYYRGYYVHHNYWRTTSISCDRKSQDVSDSYTKEQWFHFAYVKNGTSITVYHDGTLVGTLDISSGVSDTSAINLIIGTMSEYGSPVSNTAIIGYMDEIRLSNIARWTSNFTPPTTQYGQLFCGYITSDNPNAYPDKGYHTDGLYYVKECCVETQNLA